MKNFFAGFIPAFVVAIAWPLINGRGADSISELLTIYLITPLIIGLIAGGAIFLLKKKKSDKENG